MTGAATVVSKAEIKIFAPLRRFRILSEQVYAYRLWRHKFA